jgi:hypothetical protein
MGIVLPRLILWLIAAFYAYGAYEHIASIAGQHGYTWSEAPAKWQALDIVYLTLDIVVTVGFLLRWQIGVFAFFAVALSQILLYTLLRPWFIDVPVKFTPAPEHLGYLNMLVIFHVVSIVLVLIALRTGALKKDVEEG